MPDPTDHVDQGVALTTDSELIFTQYVSETDTASGWDDPTALWDTTTWDEV